MAYPIDSPYDKKVSKLQHRLGNANHPGNQLRGKLQKFKTKQFGYQQEHTPPTPMPWSTQYETTVGNLGRERDFNLANLQSQEQGVQQAYGFNDASNPFARARLLESTYNQSQARTQNSYAGGGQLYSGSLSNALGTNRFNFEHSMGDELTKYQAALADLAQKRLGTQNAFTEGEAQAKAKALEDALAQAPDPSEAPAKPPFIGKYSKQLHHKLKQAKGHPHKAQKIRQRIKNLP
jgi:hypothetical protein